MGKDNAEAFGRRTSTKNNCKKDIVGLGVMIIISLLICVILPQIFIC
jgi:hypothetical protein